MSTPACRVVPASSLPTAELAAEPLDPDQVVAGDPQVHGLALDPIGGLEVGIWQHTAGTSTDVESDEVFVVLSGRATIVVEDGPTLQLGPGDVGYLRAGSRTSWTVHEDLRKVYFVATS
ncbi:MAG TPA: cupin domain-containing protein [Candidatus Nanopelagicales bacterium]|jgi:uncharacterized cupin superfamily protein|nr:cupin domain-containing protein [Candidatus Nanopelagicales bacterium]